MTQEYFARNIFATAQFESGNATFPGPTTGFTPGHKKATIIACGFEAPVCPEVSNFALAALKQMGWQGSVQDGQWFVTEGLKSGDKVVVEGFQKFAAGDKVKPALWTEADASVGASPDVGQTRQVRR